MVEALTQRLAVDGDVALRISAELLVEDGCVASEYRFGRSWVQLLENARMVV